MLDKELERMPANVDITRIYDEGYSTIGYYAIGHWRRNSVAIATNIEYCADLGYNDFKHGYMRKIPWNVDDMDYQLIICARGRGAFPVTYSWS